jgi:hypothetical protein
MDALIFVAGQQASQASVDLHRLGTRCLREPASRRLDGEIYCAIHKVTDWNPLWNDQMFWAKENGEVLVEHCPGDGGGLNRSTQHFILKRKRWSVWLCVKDIVEVLLRQRRRSYGIAGSEGSL